MILLRSYFIFPVPTPNFLTELLSITLPSQSNLGVIYASDCFILEPPAFLDIIVTLFDLFWNLSYCWVAPYLGVAVLTLLGNDLSFNLEIWSAKIKRIGCLLYRFLIFILSRCRIKFSSCIWRWHRVFDIFIENELFFFLYNLFSWLPSNSEWHISIFLHLYWSCSFIQTAFRCWS